MTKIRFGTDGWRAIIAKEYTVDNVIRVTLGVSSWLKKNHDNPTVVVGYDCRFGGEMFADYVAKSLSEEGVSVILADGIVTTPMVSLATTKFGAAMGVVLTASHNPPSYNGYKLKGSFGGPLLPQNIQEVEDLIPDGHHFDLMELDQKDVEDFKNVERKDLEQLYVDHVEAAFDMESIRSGKMQFAYDAMYGAGFKVMQRLVPDSTFLHCDHNPSFYGVAPEPIHKNLGEFSALIHGAKGDIACGLATDGDADRIGLYDNEGNFVDSHHIILLLIKYLVEEKGFKGKVITAFSVTPKVKKMCEILGLEHETTKIGFKYIAGHMVNGGVLLGGEESGGIAIEGHIPERDGIWMGLTIWEYMVKSGKTLSQLIDEVYEMVGSFKFERIDLHIPEAEKVRIMANCEKGNYSKFGSYKVQNVETTDGFKYFLDDEQWVMIRPSGTEPVLRTYAEGPDTPGALQILEDTHKTLLG